MIKVVADTNVYISALNFRGVPDEILVLAKKNYVGLFVSAFILEEIEGGVIINKFEWSNSQAKKAITSNKTFSHLINCKEKIDDIVKDKTEIYSIFCLQNNFQLRFPVFSFCI